MKTKTRARKAPTRTPGGGTARKKASGKTPRKKGSGKKSSVRKSKARKATATMSTARKSAARENGASKTTAKKTTAKKTPAKKTPATETTTLTTTLDKRTGGANGAPSQAVKNPGTNATSVGLPPQVVPRRKGRSSVWDTLTDHLRRTDAALPDERPIGRWIAAAFLSGCLVGWVLAALI